VIRNQAQFSIQNRFTSLRRTLGRIPWSLGVALGMIVFFLPHPEWHQDLEVFRSASDTLRHPYWARGLFSLLQALPEPVAFAVLSAACTALLYFAVRVFQGRHWVVFTSFAFAWTLFYGQIDGLVIGGLALAWWSNNQQRPTLAGAGLLLASIKPQLALPIALALWWWSPSRLKTLIVPLLAALASFVVWGWWVPEWLAGLRSTQDLVGLSRNLSFWPMLGPWVLLVWPIVFLLPLDRKRKLIAIAAGTMLSMPYFPLPSMVLVLTMPVPIWAWLAAQLPALAGLVGEWTYAVARLLAVTLLAWATWPAARWLPQHFRTYLRKA
jgi:hypothetical protein